MTPLTVLLTKAGYFRRPRLLDPEASLHKEWMHFCVLGPTTDILVNFSLMGDVFPGAARGAEAARLTVLVRDGAWDGDVDTIPAAEVDVRAGRFDAAFGASAMIERDGVIEVRASLRERPISLALRLRPATIPLFRPNTLLDGAPIHWLVMPRLFASGTVTVAGTTHMLDDAPCYHDHNWGKWRWGHDFSWSWGFGLPGSRDVPWSVVFTRLVDRARTRDLGHGLFLWEGAVQRRIFQEGTLRVRQEGFLRPRRVPKFPRVMGLLSPELCTDVPRAIVIDAEEFGDAVSCRFEAEDVAQIVVPNEADLGLTIINEVVGKVALSGRVGGAAVTMNGRAVFELLTCG